MKKRKSIGCCCALSLVTLAISLSAGFAWASSDAKPVRFGISPFAAFSYNDPIIEETIRTIHEAVAPRPLEVIHPLTMKEYQARVSEGCCSILLSSSGFYSRMVNVAGLKAAVTVVSDRTPDPNHAEGSAFIARKDRSDLMSIESLKGTHLAAVEDGGFSGFYIGMDEVYRHGFDPEKFFSRISYLGAEAGDIVSAVREGRADVGLVRTCTLEAMGEDWSDLRVIGRKDNVAFGCATSTELFPNWTISTTPAASPEFTRKVVRALLMMKPIEKGLHWGIATDFTAADRLYRDLKLGPYAYLREWTLARVWKEYRSVIVLAILALVGALLHSIRAAALIKRATDQLNKAHEKELRIQEESRRIAEHMDKMQRIWVVNQMGTMFAHELKQPLGAISSYGYGLLKWIDSGRELPKESLRQTVEKISNASKRAGATLDRLRLYARGKREVLLFDAVESAEAVISECEKSMRMATPIETRLSGAPVLLEMSPLEFEALVTNIIRNASDAVKELPDPQILVELSQGDGKAFLSVSDNGPKLGEKEFERLRSFSLMSTKENGMGFGLSIIRSIVEQNRGEIAFTQGAERGLTVKIAFPLADIEDEKNADTNRG